MNVKVGGAHGSKGHPEPGDQGGEVSTASYSLEVCKNLFRDFLVYRPKNVTQAKGMAELMQWACDDPNVGYRAEAGGVTKTPESNYGIFLYYEGKCDKCNCDCTSLVSFCVSTVTNQYIFEAPATIGARLKQTGLFNNEFPVSSYSENNPPCTGDILVKSKSDPANPSYPCAHAEMIVQGAEPTGSGSGGSSVYSSSGYLLSSASLDFSKPIPSDYWSAASKQGLIKDDYYNGKHISIYTPPGYSASMTCNTFYFKMGSGNNASQMWNFSGAISNFNYVIDNLVIRGDIKHTIIVTIDGGGEANWYNSNASGLVGYIESRYNVSHSPSCRAIGGWSLGAMDTVNYMVSNSGLFGWIDVQAATSSSVNAAFYNMSSSPCVCIANGASDSYSVKFTQDADKLFRGQSVNGFAATNKFSKNIAQVVPGTHAITSQVQFFYNAIKFFFNGSGLNYNFPSSNYNLTGADSSFIPRKTEPQPGTDEYEKYYRKAFETPYGITKNGAYAWGRFNEVLGGLECLLNKSAPRRWFQEDSDGYSRGVSPALGAVMCFTNLVNPQDAGMACNVEEVGTNSVLVSRMSVKDGKFECVRMNKTDGSWDIDIDGDGKKEYMFQGFIYNPSVQRKAYDIGESLLARFIENAKNQVGNDGSYVTKYTNVSPPAAWSGAFVVAVAKETGRLINVIIPEETSCSQLPETGVSKGMGFWLDGPANDGLPYPQIGDILCIRTVQHSTNNKYECDKLAIIVEVDSSNATYDETNKNAAVGFRCVVGNNADKVSLISYKTNQSCISGIFRPDWDKVDGLQGTSQYYYNIQAMYAQGAAMEDAVIKDMKYIKVNSNGIEPSIDSTGLTLCAINYSGIVGSVYSLFAQVYSSNASNPGMVVDLLDSSQDSLVEFGFDSEYITADSAGDLTYDMSGINQSGQVDMGNGVLVLNNVVREVYGFLNNLFKNPAGAVGFMANIYAESGFNPAAYNSSSGASGLCQWLNSRRTSMIAHCEEYNGTEWRSNLSGQLYHLQLELELIYKSTLNCCKNCSKNLSGAKVAAEFVLKNFEIPGNYDVNVPLRNNYATKIWQLLFGS